VAWHDALDLSCSVSRRNRRIARTTANELSLCTPQRGRDGFSGAAALAFSGDHIHQREQEMISTATMAAAIVKISMPAYDVAVDSRGSSAFPSSRSSAWTCFPFRDEI
jgi:hypothetical protein